MLGQKSGTALAGSAAPVTTALLRMNLKLTALICHIFPYTNIEWSLHRMRIDVHLNIHADYILIHKCSDE